MKRAIICFTRVPKPGVTKTRLLPILSGDQCAKLHTAFLTDLAQVYSEIEADLFVAYTADPDWEILKSIFPVATGFFPQEGADLGEKMYRAICAVLEQGYDAVVLTGADLPRLTTAHLDSGFAALETADIAIGPTSDGGYYLVGTKQPHRVIFENQQYGGATVLENTLAAGQAAGLQVALADPCDDVDTPEDLRALVTQLSPESATSRYLSQLQKEGVSL
jgi:rSAM/selenodomain-associated transferase 1